MTTYWLHGASTVLLMRRRHGDNNDNSRGKVNFACSS